VLHIFFESLFYGNVLIFEYSIMQVSIWFSGPAGAWIVTAWLVLGKLLAKKWYFVLGDKEYESIIKWWNNLFVLYISDKKNYISKHIDYFFAYDKYAIEKNQSVYSLWNIYEVDKKTCGRQNTCSVGMAGKILGIVFEELESAYAELFSGEVLEKNIADLKVGYELVSLPLPNPPLVGAGTQKVFWYGNEAIGKGAIASGLEWYSAYPMTPASSLIEVITESSRHAEFSSASPEILKQVQDDGPSSGWHPIFFQWEDEIAVSMSMLGAHFAGKRAMCGTSGWGFALMTESISYANIAELGGVYILSQRAGPSTGTPTYTEQGDLNFALNASFGDTFPIVVAPSSVAEAYNLIGKALNRSDQYQHPVIFLVDKMLSESYVAIDEGELVAESIDKWKVISDKDGMDWFARYSVTQDGVSPYSVPGQPGVEFIATSYEHDVYGATSEEPLTKKIMTQKRHKKMKTFVKEVFSPKFEGYEIINPNVRYFYVTFGRNRYVLESVLADKSDRGLIVVTVLQPINPKLALFFEQKFEQIEQLVFVEQNYSGQFEKQIKVECGLMTAEWAWKISSSRKYANYPFFEEDFSI